MKPKSRFLNRSQSLFVSISFGIALPMLAVSNASAADGIWANPAAQNTTTLTSTSGSANLIWAGSSFSVGQMVRLGGTVPGGFTANTNYFVVSAVGTTLQLSATSGGAAISATTSIANGIGQMFQSWQVATNWDTSTIAGGVDSIATFTNGPVANVAGVSLDGNVTIGKLAYTNATNASDMALISGNSAGNTLTFATSGSVVGLELPLLEVPAASVRLLNLGGNSVLKLGGTQGLVIRSSAGGATTGSGIAATSTGPAKNIRLTNVDWSSFSGGVTIERGEVAGQAAWQLGQNASAQNLTVGNSQTLTNSLLAGFQFGSADQQVGKLDGNNLGRIWGNTRTLTFGKNDATGGDFGGIIGQDFTGATNNTRLIKVGAGTQTISGLIKGTGTLVTDSTAVSSSGTLILSGNNGFTGVVTINNFGTIEIGHNNALGSGGICPIGQVRGNVLVKAGATLDLKGNTPTEQIDLQGGKLKNSVAGGGVNNGLAGVTFSAAGDNLVVGSPVLITGGGGTDAAATAYFGLATADSSHVTITNGGTGYTAAPTVVFTGGGGTGMAGTATLTDDAVTAVTITNVGSGYTSAPTISFTGGNGSGATATVNPENWKLTSIQITNPGTAYTSAPAVGIDANGDLVIDGNDGTQPTWSDRSVGNVVVSQDSSLQDDADLTLVTVTASAGGRTLTKTGAGTLTLAGSGDNAWLALDAQSGTVLLDKEIAGRAANILTLNGANAALPAAGANNKQINTLVVNSGTFDLNGQSSVKATVTSLSGTGGVVTNNGTADATLYIGDGNGDYADVLTYSGVIKDGATRKTSIQVQGVATSTREVTLDGANTYTGTTAVTAGKLTLKSAYLGNTSTVVIGINGKLNLDHAGTDVVGKLTLSTGDQADGIYGALLSGAEHEIAEITGTGRIQVIAPPVSGYSTWALATVGGDPSNVDTDNDGVDNGVEYFMNADSGFTANPGLSGDTVTWINGGNIPAGDYGSQFVVQTSSDLVIWTPVDVGSLTTNTSGPGGALSYTLTGAGKRFVRLAVTPN